MLVRLSLKIVIAGLFAAGAATAQPMSDTSSTYIDAWEDETYLYGSGATAGSLSIHLYAVDVQIVSPTGRSSSSIGTYQSAGYIVNGTMLAWDYSETGDYMVSTTHRGWCTVGLIAFVLAYHQFPKRPPPYKCNEGDATCADGNNEAPLGTRKGGTCVREEKCCKAGGVQVPGWCRKDICNKCSSQSNDPQPSQCFGSEANCTASSPNLCGSGCINP